MHVCAHCSILVCPHFFQFVWNLVKRFKTIDVICRLVIKTFKRFSLGRFLNFQKARLIDESRYWLVIVILQWYALCLASLVLYHFQPWVFGLQMPHPDGGKVRARCKFQKVIQLNFIWSNSMLWYLCYWDTRASRRTVHSGFFYLPITDNFKRSMKSLQLACLKLIGVYTKDLCL